jgi:hypothetical protein
MSMTSFFLERVLYNVRTRRNNPEDTILESSLVCDPGISVDFFVIISVIYVIYICNLEIS